MKFKVLDLENEITSLDKFVVTCFLDVPTRGMSTTYIEVCSSQEGAFELLTPQEITIQQDERFYFDVKTCARMFKAYKHVKGGGEHLQTVGVKQLHVIPRKCEIRKVAPPRSDPTSSCYSIGFDIKPLENRSWGTWLYWVQSAEYDGIRDPLSRVYFEFRVGNIRVENFYFFITQPPGYRLDDSRCEVSSEKDPLIQTPTLHPVFEFEVSDDFPVFPMWKEYFYKRKILRNRRYIDLKNGQQVSLFFSLTSDLLSRKLALRSYFIGIGIALSVSFLSEIISSVALGFSAKLFFGVSLVLTCILGYWGWKLIK
jgi:hypothetical protein